MLDRLNAVTLALLFVGISTFIAGCAVIQTHNITDTSVLSESEGILIARIKSNVPVVLEYYDHMSSTNFGTNLANYYSGPKGAIQIAAGDQYYVLHAKEGNYMWAYVVFGQRRADFRTTNQFMVRKGLVNYVGDITIQVSDLQMQMSSADHLEKARNYLRENFPKSYETFRLNSEFTQTKQ